MIEDIVIRLRASTGDVFKTIDGTADYAAIYDKKPQRANVPAAYVLPMRERGTGMQRATMMSVQKRFVTFGVALVVPATASADPKGEKALDLLKAPRQAIDDALNGWTPPDAIDVVSFTEGRFQLLAEGFLWWLDSYTTQFETRKQVTT